MRLTLLTSLILFPLFEIFSQNISGNVQSYPFSLLLEEVAVTLKNNQTGDVLGTDSTDANGNYSIDYVIVGVDDKKNLPIQFYLSSAYPNPFNPETKIDFYAAKQGRFAVKLFNIIGELIFSNNYDLIAGFHSFTISGLGSAGVYLFYISGEDFSSVQKLLLLDGGSGSVNIELRNSGAALRKVSYDNLRIEFRKPGYTDKDTIVSWAMNLVVNASLNKLAELRNIELTAFVEVSAVQVPLRYFTAKLKNNAGTVIQTKYSGDTNVVLFTDVSNLSNYTIEAVSDTASRPNFISTDTTIYLLNDTAIVKNPLLFLRPVVFANLEDKTINEDEIPLEPRLHDLRTKVVGYDSLGSVVNPQSNDFSIIAQTNPALAPVSIELNRFTRLDGLLPEGNGSSNITVKVVSPNGTIAQRSFNLIVKPLADISVDAIQPTGEPIYNFKVTAWNTNFQIMQTKLSGNSNHVEFHNLPQPVAIVEITKTDSSSISFDPKGFYFNSFVGDTSLTAVLLRNERLLTFNFTDYFLNTPVNNVYVKTSKEAGTNTPLKQWKASLNEEKIIANGPAHLRSGIILAPGSRDTVINHYLVNADTLNQGLDSVYLKGLLTFGASSNAFRGNVFSENNDKYVGLTPTSVKDTIWIYGLIPPVSNNRFRTVGQLNEIAKVLNDTAKVLTTTKDFPDGLFGVDKRIIAIADSNFNKPDSIAQFLYSNMKAVPQSSAPIDLETRSNYIRIIALSSGTGSNAPNFKEDGLTLKGGNIKLAYSLSNGGVNTITKEELTSMIMGSVESNIGYPSIYDKQNSIITPQDIRRQSFIIYRFNQGGGKFPDLPLNF